MHFIREMEKVYKATGDKNFNIILIDYNSIDIDVEKELKRANLPRYNFCLSKQLPDVSNFYNHC